MPVSIKGVEKQRHGNRIVGPHGGSKRPGAGHPGTVGEEQLEAAIMPVPGRFADALPVVGVGAGVEQHLGDGVVVDLDRALQCGTVTRAPPSLVARAGTGVEEEPDHVG